MKYLVTLLSALLMLSACSKDDSSDNKTTTKASRAVMIYMAGENSLTEYRGLRYLQNDLTEMVEGSKYLADDQRVFIFVDSLGTNSKYKGTPYIIEVHGGKAISQKVYDKDFYSGDPDRFREVVSWMTSNIKADGYGLVLWGHATGWKIEESTRAGSSRRGYGSDTNEDVGPEDDRWMNITDMATELGKLPKLDFIFADCCNMVNAENAYELRNVTNYLIGSPAEIPGNGAPYHMILPLLFKNGSELYKSIIDTYYDYYLEAYKGTHLSGYSVPLAAVDTKNMSQLATATHDVLDKFTGGYPQYPDSPDMTGIAFYDGYDEAVFYDMRAFIKRNTTAEVFQTWDQAFNQAVPYYRMSMKWMTIYNGAPYYNLERAMNSFDQDQTQYGCMSMFIPMSLSAYNGGYYAYNLHAAEFAWNRVMDWSRFGW